MRYRPRGVASALALSVLLALPSCRKASATMQPAPGRARASTPAPIIATPSTPPAAAVVRQDDVLAIFRAEAQHRPNAGPRVEDVLAAFAAAGAPAKEVRQHLAKPFGAAYCAGAEAANGIALSICEFTTPAGAVAGRAASTKGLASIPNREIDVNGAMMLTLRERKPSAESQALARTLRRAFAQLKK